MKKTDLDLYTDYLLSTLKSNANLAKSPARTLRTQSNHVSMVIYATFKLECLSIANKLNSFALCRKLLINTSRTAYAQRQLFRALVEEFDSS